MAMVDHGDSGWDIGANIKAFRLPEKNNCIKPPQIHNLVKVSRFQIFQLFDDWMIIG